MAESVIMFNPSKVVKIVFYFLSFSFLLIFLLAKLIFPSFLKNHIISYVEKSCNNDCHFKVEEVKIRWLSTQVELNGVSFRLGDKKASLFNIKARKALIEINLRKIKDHILNIKNLAIDGLEIIVDEGDGKTIYNKTNKLNQWDLVVDGVVFKNANFTYNRSQLGKIGIINISKINGTVGQFGSTQALRNILVNASLTAVLENSGRLNLNLSSVLFSKKLHIDLSGSMKDLNLSQTNSYFTPVAGMKLGGRIINGTAKVTVRGKNISTKVSSKYKDIKIDFEKTKDRSSLSAFFINMFSGVVKSDKEKSSITVAKREDKEPLVGFIIRGISKSAIKVLTDPNNIDKKNQ